MKGFGLLSLCFLVLLAVVVLPMDASSTCGFLLDIFSSVSLSSSLALFVSGSALVFPSSFLSSSRYPLTLYTYTSNNSVVLA